MGVRIRIRIRVRVRVIITSGNGTTDCVERWGLGVRLGVKG